MKDEPQLVDIYAMFAMTGLLFNAPKKARSEEIAYEAYEQAEAMMGERNRRYNSEGKTDE